MSVQEIDALLHRQNKLQLGTINPDGTPHMVTMFYAMVDAEKLDGFEGTGPRIAFWTYGKSQKAKNLERDPRVTCLVEAGVDYFELHGALIYGTISVLTDPNTVRYVGTEVVRRMMNLDDDEALRPFVEATAAKRWAYVVEPGKSASWDHRKM
jgi:hypothetical protein